MMIMVAFLFLMFFSRLYINEGTKRPSIFSCLCISLYYKFIDDYVGFHHFSCLFSYQYSMVMVMRINMVDYFI